VSAFGRKLTSILVTAA